MGREKQRGDQGGKERNGGREGCAQSVVEESTVDGRVKLNRECQQAMNTEARRLQTDFPCT